MNHSVWRNEDIDEKTKYLLIKLIPSDDFERSAIYNIENGGATEKEYNYIHNYLGFTLYFESTEWFDFYAKSIGGNLFEVALHKEKRKVEPNNINNQQLEMSAAQTDFLKLLINQLWEISGKRYAEKLMQGTRNMDALLKLGVVDSLKVKVDNLSPRKMRNQSFDVNKAEAYLLQIIINQISDDISTFPVEAPIKFSEVIELKGKINKLDVSQ